MTRKEKKEELIDLFTTGAINISALIDECFEFEQQHPNWISVKDRKPKLKHSDDNLKYSDTVIVTNGKYRTAANWTHYILGGWYGWYDEGGELKNVTHWMPMPSVEHLKK